MEMKHSAEYPPNALIPARMSSWAQADASVSINRSYLINLKSKVDRFNSISFQSESWRVLRANSGADEFIGGAGREGGGDREEENSGRIDTRVKSFAWNWFTMK